MKAIFDQFDKVLDFPHDRAARVEETGGATVVRIYDPTQFKHVYETDTFTDWDRVPGLKDLAVRTYVKACTAPGSMTHLSRAEMASKFKRLCKVLVDTGKDDRTPETLTYYDCEEVIEEIAALGLVKPDDVLRPLKLIVDEIWQDEALDGARDPHLFVRKAAFPGSGVRVGKREVLPDAVFTDIYAAAAADSGRMMAEAEAFRGFFETRGQAFKGAPPVKPGLHECAAWVKNRFGPRLPSLQELEDVDRPLWRHIKWGYGWKAVVRLIHPTLHDLVPLFALLGCQTLFNKTVLAELSLDDIDRTELAGTRRVVFTPLKRRAGKQQLRSFALDPASDNPDVVVRFLEDRTAGIRSLIHAPFDRRLFLFWSLRSRTSDQFGAEGPSAFYHTQTGGGGDGRLTWAWKAWCEQKKFGDVQFASLRITGLNLGHRAFGGDVRAIAALASHSSLEVFDHHYKSGHSRASNDRRMGKAMLLRDRMLGSDGKIDPTRRLRGEGVEAATPGFGCLDPFASPMPGQREGRPCTAYGQCPDCPLATCDVRVPANLVRLKQLESEYVAAREYLAPHYWRDKYSLQLEAVRRDWLPAFRDPAVVEAATRMQARPLPPLG